MSNPITHWGIHLKFIMGFNMNSNLCLCCCQGNKGNRGLIGITGYIVSNTYLWILLFHQIRYISCFILNPHVKYEHVEVCWVFKLFFSCCVGNTWSQRTTGLPGNIWTSCEYIKTVTTQLFTHLLNNVCTVLREYFLLLRETSVALVLLDHQALL
jgi:hypothetical protein